MHEPRDDLLARLLASLADNASYELHGATVADAWGTGQWIRFTDPDGREHYLRIVVEEYRPTD